MARTLKVALVHLSNGLISQLFFLLQFCSVFSAKHAIPFFSTTQIQHGTINVVAFFYFAHWVYLFHFIFPDLIGLFGQFIATFYCKLGLFSIYFSLFESYKIP